MLERVFKYNLIQDGTIILFDDYNCSKANPNFGERKAFNEIMEKNKDFSSSLFYYYGWHGAAYIMHKMDIN